MKDFQFSFIYSCSLLHVDRVSHLSSQLMGCTTEAAHDCSPCLTSLVLIRGGDEMPNSSSAYVMLILASCLTWLA